MAMDEIWRQAVDLWRSGGPQGIYKATNFLVHLGWKDRRAARLQLKAAIKIFKGEADGDGDAQR